MTDSLLTVTETAALLRVSRRTVERLIVDGKFRALHPRMRNTLTPGT